MYKLSKINFNYTVNEIENIKNKIISDYKNFITLNILDSSLFLEKYLELDSFTGIIYSIQLLSYVSDRSDIRNASTQFKLELENYIQSFYSSVQYYNIFLHHLKNIKENNNNDKEQKKLIDKILRKFEDNGVHLKEKDRNIFIEKSEQLSNLENKFSQNISNNIPKLIFTKKELEGIDEYILKNYKKIGDKYIFTTSYPDQSLILKNCSVEKTRKKMYITFESTVPQNLTILKKVLVLRNTISNIFGFKNSLSYFMSKERLASIKKVEVLVKNILKIIIPKAKKEYKSLLLFSQKKKLNEYDISYYSAQYKKKYFDIDDNKLKKYFPSNYSIPKILSIFSSLFGIKIKLVKSDKKKRKENYWHSDVDLYKVKDVKTKKVLGYIYFDLYPRTNKYTHAMTYEIQNPFYYNGKRVESICAIVCNFTTPEIGKKYSLLTFGEIITFCHELGHALHCTLSNTKYEIFSGINSEIDFVEMPSQFLENWCWEPLFLKKITRHEITGKSIPKNMVHSIIKNRYFNVGISYLRQLLLIQYDFHVHQKKNINISYLKQEWFNIMKKTFPYDQIENIYPMCRFDHLMGYQAAYYSYLWSIFYSYNAYHKFEKNCFDKKIGIKIRKEIFEKGCEINGSHLVENFINEKIKNKYFFKIFI
jgi:Zn-dependent oligopeptidase